MTIALFYDLYLSGRSTIGQAGRIAVAIAFGIACFTDAGLIYIAVSSLAAP